MQEANSRTVGGESPRPGQSQWAGESQWTGGAPWSGELLGPVLDLNHRFLDLAAAPATAWPMSAGAALALELQSLSPAQRGAAAACPYALFDLRFQDAAYWRSRLQKSEWRVADEPAGDAQLGGFVRLALFYAWHVATGGGLAAELMLGMSGGTADALRRIAIDRLPALADAEAPNLAPRWGGCSAYWTALIGAALRADAAALRRVQLYGLQLAAADRLATADRRATS